MLGIADQSVPMFATSAVTSMTCPRTSRRSAALRNGLMKVSTTGSFPGCGSAYGDVLALRRRSRPGEHLAGHFGLGLRRHPPRRWPRPGIHPASRPSNGAWDGIGDDPLEVRQQDAIAASSMDSWLGRRRPGHGSPRRPRRPPRRPSGHRRRPVATPSGDVTRATRNDPRIGRHGSQDRRDAVALRVPPLPPRRAVNVGDQLPDPDAQELGRVQRSTSTLGDTTVIAPSAHLEDDVGDVPRRGAGSASRARRAAAAGCWRNR